jgi:hypothetical protein
VTVTATSSSTPFTVLTVLAQTAATTAQETTQREVSQVTAQIQNQLNQKIAALEAGPDQSVANASQLQINSLKAQANAISAVATTYSSNANVLSDLQNQLASLQTEATNGNTAAFDATLAVAQIDIGNLGIAAPTAPFQPDQVAPLKATGLGIQSGESYDLSTPAGQAAAAADIQSAQTLVGQIFTATTGNQLLATSVSTVLDDQINTLTTQQQQQDASNQADIQAQVANLTQLAQNQEHLIELSLGNTQLVANALLNEENPPQPPTSVYEVLQNVAASASTSTGSTSTSGTSTSGSTTSGSAAAALAQSSAAQSSSAILSLLA